MREQIQFYIPVKVYIDPDWQYSENYTQTDETKIINIYIEQQ